MYTTVNILSELIDTADQFVKDNDRQLYVPFFKTIEIFCIRENVLIGGEMGIGLLTGRPAGRDSIYWDLYTEDPYNMAKKLADELYNTKSPHVNTKYISVKTDLRNREMTIFINMRALIKIYVLDKYRNIGLIELMGPAARTGYYTHDTVQLIPEEIQIIEIYRGLYTPARVSQWQMLLEAENKIFELINDSVQTKALKVVGGGTSGKYDNLLLKRVIGDDVIIGDYALQELNISTGSSQRLQFLTSRNIREIAKLTETEINRNRDEKVRVTYFKYPLNLPTDFRIIKYTLYVNIGEDQTAIADVFNPPSFEMIPYWNVDTSGDKRPNKRPDKHSDKHPDKHSDKHSDKRYGNPWVLLRFRFIDLWILKIISNFDTNSNFIRGKIISIIDSVNKLREIVRGLIKTNPERLFQSDNYVGVYVSDQVAKKKMIKETGERYPNYYPAKK